MMTFFKTIEVMTWITIIIILTHLLEHISTAADMAQQLAIGDGHVMVGRVSLPEMTAYNNRNTSDL